jgi:hypothetical protein
MANNQTRTPNSKIKSADFASANPQSYFIANVRHSAEKCFNTLIDYVTKHSREYDQETYNLIVNGKPNVNYSIEIQFDVVYWVTGQTGYHYDKSYRVDYDLYQPHLFSNEYIGSTYEYKSTRASDSYQSNGKFCKNRNNNMNSNFFIKDEISYTFPYAIDNKMNNRYFLRDNGYKEQVLYTYNELVDQIIKYGTKLDGQVYSKENLKIGKTKIKSDIVLVPIYVIKVPTSSGKIYLYMNMHNGAFYCGTSLVSESRLINKKYLLITRILKGIQIAIPVIGIIISIIRKSLVTLIINPIILIVAIIYAAKKYEPIYDAQEKKNKKPNWFTCGGLSVTIFFIIYMLVALFMCALSINVQL